jgi:hypothetical protein
MIQTEMVDLILNPLLTAVILVVVHFSEMQVINFGTLEPNLMDIQPLTVHMNTAKMATFTLVVGKSSGSKQTWPIWIKELLLLKVAALATSVMRTGSILTIQTTMATTMVVMTASMMVMTTTMVVMTASMMVMTATMVVMTATMVGMTATMVETTEIAMKLSKPLSKKLKKLLLKPKIYFKVLKALLSAFAPSRLILISSMRKLRKHAIKLLKQ